MNEQDEWPFDQEPNVAAITTRQVLDLNLPVLVVTHYDDDHSWGFVCGTTDDVADGRVICMAEALEIDGTLRDVADLPPGWSARRDAQGSAWVRCEDDWGDEEEIHSDGSV